jgi:hypothetical protein
LLKTVPKQLVRKEQNGEEEGWGSKTPALLLAVRTFLLLVLGRLLRAGRGYALAGAGVVAAAVVAVSLLSWLAPDSDRPIASPLEAVGRVASNVVEQVDDQVQARVGTDGEKTILRSLREGIATVSSITPWPSGKSVKVAVGPSSSSTASPDSASSSADDAAAAPTREESSWASDGAPSEPAPSAPSQPSETPIGTDAPPSPVTSEPVPPPAEEEPPVAEEPSLAPVAEEPSLPPVAEEPPAAEEPAPPPSAEEPPPAAEEPVPPPSTEEPPPTASDPQPETIADHQ